MTIARFQYQHDAVVSALEQDPDRIVLNVGCNDDPGGIKAIDRDRIVNCDIFDYDDTMGRPNLVDEVFDCGEDVWPFDDDSVSMTVFGDVVEHLTEQEFEHALSEARRVGQSIVITCPRDDRDDRTPPKDHLFMKGSLHITVVTDEYLMDMLDGDWLVTELRCVDYDFVPEGYFLTAEALL